MKKTFKHRKGSLTILAIFIFLMLMTSLTLMLRFSTIQAALSRNQIEKVQSRYKTEDGLNKLLYDEKIMGKLIKHQMLERYRANPSHDGSYTISVQEEDELKSLIERGSFTFQNIDKREIVYFDIASKHNNLTSSIIAYGTCINELFELNKPLLDEELLTEGERRLFIDFMEKMENENWDYDFYMGSKYKKVNTKNDIGIGFISEMSNGNWRSPKKLIQNYGKVNQISEKFLLPSLIVHLKKDKKEDARMVIGEYPYEDDEGGLIYPNPGLITLIGVLYLEGDLIINQDFEFEGLIIMNEGKIIVNSLKKPEITGMIINKGEKLDLDSLKLVYDQKAVYKAGSFLPGFLDIDIQVIKKY